MYKQEQQRKIQQRKFSTIDDYLASLGLEITVYEDPKDQTPRIAQLTQKTNQFNLTTRRYTETEIKNFIYDEDCLLYTFGLTDKFGDCGITGLCIIKIDQANLSAFVDSFLISCRVFGRKAELIFMDFLFNKLSDLGIKEVYADYTKTKKNMLVENFWNQIGLDTLTYDDKRVNYKINLEKYKYSEIDYIKLHN